jgi:hypothetical protein
MKKKTNLGVSKSKSGIYILTIAAVLVLGGVSSYVFLSSRPTDNQQNNQLGQTANQTKTGKVADAYVSISNDDIQHTGGDVDFMWQPDMYPVVALVHIDSIDGGRTYSPVFEQYVAPHTYGKMTVRENYKGDVKSGEQLDYSRLGGIVTYEEYWKSLNKQQQDKILYLNNGKQPAHEKYVQDKSTDDIDIEVGKDYLVFLTPQSSKDGKVREYVIGGYQLGLREARGSGANITVLNNDTKKWESLDRVVKLN